VLNGNQSTGSLLLAHKPFAVYTRDQTDHARRTCPGSSPVRRYHQLASPRPTPRGAVQRMPTRPTDQCVIMTRVDASNHTFHSLSAQLCLPDTRSPLFLILTSTGEIADITPQVNPPLPPLHAPFSPYDRARRSRQDLASALSRAFGHGRQEERGRGAHGACCTKVTATCAAYRPERG
jgi:hypothetical protein